MPTSTSVARRRRVLVVVCPVWEESASKVLKGIAHYQRDHEHWETHWDNTGQSLHDREWLKREPWDGVISRHTNSLQVDVCAELKIPLVDVHNVDPFPGVPNIELDNAAVGSAGAEHFVERGFRHFAFCGFKNERWSTLRRDGFRSHAVRLGATTAVHETMYPGSYSHGCTPQWHKKEVDQIAAWLQELPHPVAVMCCNDFRALHVLDAARVAGLRVPEDVAVLGANDDEVRCELAYPPLSSVATNHFRSGFKAAEALHQLMNNESVAGHELAVGPGPVATRHSTDVLAVPDKRIAAAILFIHQNACRGLTVDEVGRHAAIARTQLEERFRKYFGRSPQAEIRRVQLNRIRQLLEETDLPLRVIADLTGFAHLEYMIVFFKRATGESPGRYRRNIQLRGSSTRTVMHPPEKADADARESAPRRSAAKSSRAA